MQSAPCLALQSPTIKTFSLANEEENKSVPLSLVSCPPLARMELLLREEIHQQAQTLQ